MAEQVELFKRKGYLVLEDFVEPEIVGRWQAALADYFRADLAHPEVWSSPTVRKRRGRFAIDESHALRNLPQMQSVLDRLGGGRFQGGEENLITRWADPDGDWAMPETGHVDLIFQAFHWRFILGATTYLFEVEPKGGALCVWPGSHLAAWEYFRAQPDRYFTGLDNRARHRMERELNAHAQNGVKPIELTARPGTVVLWHSFLLHEASPNIGRLPRAGVFFRWGEPVPSGEPLETFGDIWEHWAI